MIDSLKYSERIFLLSSFDHLNSLSPLSLSLSLSLSLCLSYSLSFSKFAPTRTSSQTFEDKKSKKQIRKAKQNILLCKVFFLERRILLAAEPIWLSFTVMFFIGPGKVFNHFGGGYLSHPIRKWPPPIIFKTVF